MSAGLPTESEMIERLARTGHALDAAAAHRALATACELALAGQLAKAEARMNELARQRMQVQSALGMLLGFLCKDRRNPAQLRAIADKLRAAHLKHYRGGHDGG